MISNREGRVIDIDGEQVPGVYATGWIKRGPIGLIGSTKSDASETIRHLVEDITEAPAEGRTAEHGEPDAILEFLAERGVEYVEWSGWQLLDAHERSLGEPHGRERIKVVPREEMLSIVRGQSATN